MHRYNGLSRQVYILLIPVACCLLWLLLAEQTVAQSTRTPRSTGSPTGSTGSPTVTPTTTITAPIPLLIFSTPPPVRNEPPLTSGYRNIPPVFADIDTYHAIQAQATFTESVAAPATIPLDAIGAVVQILRCDGFGCDTPVGSGVIIHPSGLILTAYHVLLENPNDLRSTAYQNFVIALTENVRTPPRPLYRASVVADKNEQDIALLAIDRTFTGDMGSDQAIAPGSLTLPALPFADVDLLFADTLYMLGYPLDGGDAVSNFQATFTSFDDNGQLIVVDRPLRQGNSGGPALALQDGRLAIAGLVIRGRSTQGRLEAEGLLRAIDQVANLNWTAGFGRAIGQQINVVERTAAGAPHVQIAIDLSTFDLVDANLRLLFYVTDEMGQPWQRPVTAGPLVLWANVRPSQMIERQTIHLTVPVAELGTSADRLRFHGLLWDRDQLLSLWASAEGVQIDPAAALAVPAATAVSVAVAPTPQPTMTPTVDQPATAAAVETAVAATLAALNTPTPTVDLVAARLTEIARTTATARALVPTPTPRPTATKTPTRTPTPQAPTPGAAREFGGIRFVYVPAGPFIMGSEDGDSDERPQSTIDVDSFWIMETEVTNAQYRAYVEATNASEPVCSDDSKIWSNAAFNGDQQPVVCISWHDAVAYAAWLSAQTGLQIRLPTEAQWEKAARGDDGRQYPWGDDEPTKDLLNYGGNVGKTTNVGTYPTGKSPYNAFDMAGNMWEWTSTIYDTERFPYPYKVDAREVLEGDDRRVLRGGSWIYQPDYARAAFRNNYSPAARHSDVGVRLVVSPGS